MATINANQVGRALLCLFLPPAAVLDKGCGVIVSVTVLTMLGWFPGVLAAMILGFGYYPPPRLVEVPVWSKDEYRDKPQREFIRLADGKLGELREDDGAPLEKSIHLSRDETD